MWDKETLAQALCAFAPPYSPQADDILEEDDPLVITIDGAAVMTHLTAYCERKRVMELILVLLGVFAVFIPALILPGPDFVVVVRSSMTHGTRSGLNTTIGVSIGLCLHASLSLLGLSALIVEYPWLTGTIRALGGSYLIYLGIRLWVQRQGITIDGADTGAPLRSRPVLSGFLVTLTNPKAIVLFASVFATAVTQTTPVWLKVVMIAMVTLCSLSWYALVSLLMSSGLVVKRFERAKHWIEKGAGTCFIGFGGKVLADARNPISP